MRVVVVSTLFPPNFVSGGTLQPQRMAHGLRRLGHEVEVFTGWTGDRPVHEVWKEVDSHGLPITWISNGRFHDPADQRNWWNPRAAAEFESLLDRFRPDVVDFNCMQGLGVGLVRAAVARGLRTVVTMHDFWWTCRRLFLVDEGLERCAIAADTGSCPCAVGVDAERERRRRLLEVLRAVDLVVIVSESMREILIANGVPADRIACNVDSLPDAELEVLSRIAEDRIPRPPTEPVRFLFAGRGDPLKGGGVLLDAVVGGGIGRTGWRLTTVGLRPTGAQLLRGIDSFPVDAIEEVPPAEMPALLGAHDVLVLPSIMRESHSILTREALAAGMVVVAAESAGPLEVVRDGWNGLVVRPGSVDGLAAAMRRLVDDRGLLHRLADGARKSEPAIKESAQVTELAGLLAGPRPSPSPPLRRLGHVVFLTGIDGAPLRYRARLPAEALDLVGISSTVLHYRDPDLLTECLAADVVVAYRVPATLELLEQFDEIRSVGIPIAFDVDDLIVDPSIADGIPALRIIDPADHEEFLRGIRRYRTTLEHCDAYIGSTPALVDAVAGLTGLPVHLFPNGVGLDLSRRSDIEVRRPRRPGPLRFGYFSGTDTHDIDWASMESAVIEVLRRRPDVELWVGGHLRTSPQLDRYGRRIRRFPFVPGHLLPARLRQLDVNLAPLVTGEVFNEAKSAIKWLEAALCLTPTVASPTQPFAAAIEDGVTGVLASTTDEWVDAILGLLDDEDARRSMAERARDRAMLDLSPWRQAARYSAILESVVAAGVDLDRRTEWQPVAISEPATPLDLEPYPFVDGPADEELPGEFLPMSRLPQSFLGLDLDRFWYDRRVYALRAGPIASVRRRLRRR
jgi:glycosyltransferase involved in cell wall biosynthesis